MNTSITVSEVSLKLADKDACLIDVRSEPEFKNEHVRGSVCMPLDKLPQQVEELRKFKSVYVLCRSGNRSAYATQFLEEQGIQAFNVEGGLVAWKKAGLPTTS